MPRTYSRGTAVLLAATLAGCASGNARVEPPSYSGGAGSAALAAYDTNKDGVLAGDELDKIPALKASLAQIDTNSDKKISADEIDSRVRAWRDSRIAEMSVRVQVNLDGAALAGAVVVLEPEAFLGSAVPSATGTTADAGVAGMTMPAERLADPNYAGMACGWYRIRITHPDKPLPPRYNTESVLGCEVAMDSSWVNDSAVKVELKSK